MYYNHVTAVRRVCIGLGMLPLYDVFVCTWHVLCIQSAAALCVATAVAAAIL